MTSSLLDLSQALAATVRSGAAGTVRVTARRRLPASGIIWQPDGLIVTANHVVHWDEGITVGLPDGREVPAAVAGRDPTTDMAILRAQASDLALPDRSDGADLAVGHLLLVIGRPAADAEASLGMVTALGGPWLTAAGGRVDRHIRMDNEMLPGFSGGPVVAADGQVIGLATSGLTHSGGVVLPAATIGRVVDALLAHGRIRRGYLGIGANPVRLPEDLVAGGGVGLMLASVAADSPAAKAGLALGDVIVAFDGQPVRRMEDLLGLLTDDRIGQPVAVRLLRGGQTKEVTVVVGEQTAGE